MNDLLYLRMAIVITGTISIGCFAFLAWLLWSIFWDVFDFFMQQHKRKANNRFKPRSEREAYRFSKGVHR